VVGTTISLLFNLFKRTDNDWITSTPRYSVLTIISLVRASISSLLIAAIFFLPVVLAFVKVHHISASGFFLALFSVIAMMGVVIAGTLSVLILLGRLYLFVADQTKYVQFYFRDFALLIGTVFMALVVFGWNIVRNIDLVAMFRAESDTTILDPSSIAEHFYLFPSHGVAMTLLNLQEGNIFVAVKNSLALVIIFGVLLGLVLLFSKAYYRLFLVCKEHVSTISKKTGILFTGGVTSALAKKEYLLFMRNIRGVLWLLFLIGIWVIQIATSGVLGKNIAKYAIDISEKQLLIGSIEFAIAVYFISAFSVRFVFPSYSLDTKTAWITKTAPYSKRKIFISKYLFFVGLFTLISLVMSFFNSGVLHTPLYASLITTSMLVVICMFIVMTSLVAGLFFQVTDSEDPEVISTSMPGIILTLILLIVGFTGSLILFYSSSSSYAITSLSSLFMIILALFTGVQGYLVYKKKLIP
jgi:hypothetical protein